MPAARDIGPAGPGSLAPAYRRIDASDMWSASRRDLLAYAVRLVAVVPPTAWLVAACSDDDGVEPDAGAPGTLTSRSSSDPPTTSTALPEVAVRVELGEYPFWSNDALMVDRAVLDAVASNYVAALDGTPPQMSRFLFGHVPIAVFDQVFAGDAAAPASTLWLFWVSGYFGGVWLRAEIDRAQPGTSVIGAIRTPPDEATFSEIAATATEALAAIDLGGDATFDYCEAALLPVEGGGGGFVNGLVENFGYNQGYLLQILEQPPAGLDTPSAYAIDCSATLSCSYASPKLAVLPSLVEDATAPGVAARIATFAAVEDAAVERGRQVWSGGLSVQGFAQESYEQLLDVSSSYLETVHATVLACVLAVESRDAELAAKAALANASMNVWLAGYQAGLLEGRDYVQPRFVFE